MNRYLVVKALVGFEVPVFSFEMTNRLRFFPLVTY